MKFSSLFFYVMYWVIGSGTKLAEISVFVLVSFWENYKKIYNIYVDFIYIFHKLLIVYKKYFLISKLQNKVESSNQSYLSNHQFISTYSFVIALGKFGGSYIGGIVQVLFNIETNFMIMGFILIFWVIVVFMNFLVSK